MFELLKVLGGLVGEAAELAEALHIANRAAESVALAQSHFAGETPRERLVAEQAVRAAAQAAATVVDSLRVALAQAEQIARDLS